MQLARQPKWLQSEYHSKDQSETEEQQHREWDGLGELANNNVCVCVSVEIAVIKSDKRVQRKIYTYSLILYVHKLSMQ